MQQQQARETPVYADIAEVRTVTGAVACNQLLSEGWVLLGIYPFTTVADMEQQPAQGERKQDIQRYVRRFVGYVVGRRRVRGKRRNTYQLLIWVIFAITWLPHENTQQAAAPYHLLGYRTTQVHVSLSPWPPHDRNSYQKEIERLVKEEQLTPEDALISLIKSHNDDQIAQFHKEEPGLHVTITISGKLTYNKELLQDLKPWTSHCPLSLCFTYEDILRLLQSLAIRTKKWVEASHGVLGFLSLLKEKAA
jgi:hypothetical protein